MSFTKEENTHNDKQLKMLDTKFDRWSVCFISGLKSKSHKGEKHNKLERIQQNNQQRNY